MSTATVRTAADTAAAFPPTALHSTFAASASNPAEPAPAADAAVVRRGPLLYALHPTESVAVTKRYDGDAPARPLAVDYQISTTDTWAHALLIPRGGAAPSLVFDPSPSAGWAESAPFDTAEYPFSISAPAVPLPSWGYWHGSKITDQARAIIIYCLVRVII